MTEYLSRRTILAAGGAAAAAGALPFGACAQAPAAGPIRTKKIPQADASIPVVGIGTSIVFAYENDPVKHAERTEVVKNLVAGGGSLIDTAASYGTAEARVGDVVSETGLRPKVFIATKYAAGGAREQWLQSIARSQERLKTKSFELLQAHNVSDPNYDLAFLKEQKAAGVTKYIGITSSSDNAYAALEPVIKREKPEFFQINYSLADRGAEERLLPAALDSGCAVLTNLPFGRASMFGKVSGKPLPDWAKDIDATSYAQIFLKFLLSHPAVTAVIPGTDKPQYMLDNLGAGRGRLPDAAMRKRIAEWWDALA
jgi:aryl-alcohol dehydrogenase-like predicted oxidoreductase